MQTLTNFFDIPSRFTKVRIIILRCTRVTFLGPDWVTEFLGTFRNWNVKGWPKTRKGTRKCYQLDTLCIIRQCSSINMAKLRLRSFTWTFWLFLIQYELSEKQKKLVFHSVFGWSRRCRLIQPTPHSSNIQKPCPIRVNKK